MLSLLSSRSVSVHRRASEFTRILGVVDGGSDADDFECTSVMQEVLATAGAAAAK